nr:interferon regulatory factor 4 [Vicugna pacos]
MNLEGSGRGGDFGMSAVSCGNGKLRQWLIDQIDSGKYPGLVWENEEKSIFRIPWNVLSDSALPPVGRAEGTSSGNLPQSISDRMMARGALWAAPRPTALPLLPTYPASDAGWAGPFPGVLQPHAPFTKTWHLSVPQFWQPCESEALTLFFPLEIQFTDSFLKDLHFTLPPLPSTQAWALFKGKFREGIDKPDPPTWKTRLRCALNKSNDFEELVERSQLDISDPYKVYRIVPEGAKKGAKQLALEDPQLPMSHPYSVTAPYTPLPAQVHNYMIPPHDRGWREFVPDQPHPEIPYQCPVAFGPRSHHWQGPSCENGCQVTGTFYACAPPESQAPGIPIEPSIRSAEALALSDCRLHICLYYREVLVKELTTSSPEGCRISHGHTYDASSLDQVVFPFPEDSGHRKNIEKLLGHLERGVVLWVAPDGLYAKRLCQSRVYWDGPLALCSDRPNKLERDQTCKLFDTQQFLSELQAFAHHGRPLPRFQVTLCFGEEFPDPQRQRKLITAHVEPLLARQLYYFAQQNSGHLLRGYDLPEHVGSPEDYHRSIRHSSIQE